MERFGVLYYPQEGAAPSCLVMKPEKERKHNGSAGDKPVSYTGQPLQMAHRRTEIAITDDVVIAVAGHAIAFNDHALLFAPGMMVIADVALAPIAAELVKVVGHEIG